MSISLLYLVIFRRFQSIRYEHGTAVDRVTIIFIVLQVGYIAAFNDVAPNGRVLSKILMQLKKIAALRSYIRCRLHPLYCRQIL